MTERKLVGTQDMFKKALDGKYAVGAYNVNNMEILQAIAEAAEETRSPIILQVSAGARKYANQTYLLQLVQAALLTTTVPIALHLDHGHDFEICKSCIDGGFSSVMIDGSRFELDENIKVTKEVVDYAHARGVSVEAELGKLAGIEDDVNVSAADAKFTNPQEAAKFVKESGCDSLAIAIGTSHGAYKFSGEAKLDFDRLAEIKKAVNDAVGYDFPIVLHGASSVPQNLVEICNKFGGKLPNAKGVPEDMLSYAAKNGVAKINIDTDLRLAMTATIREFFANSPEKFDPREYMGPGRTAVKELVKHKMQVLGTAGHA
ncbi:fructose-bisphosphate aldolase, class II [Candidatus Gastranaerophilus sp. (ex Termes propinquus)]|nr:fructose-bisphosphate aldolase, class II [Candidatus Gastranaerophilus sp. (ex Termes propinquus)]